MHESPMSWLVRCTGQSKTILTIHYSRPVFTIRSIKYLCPDPQSTSSLSCSPHPPFMPHTLLLFLKERGEQDRLFGRFLDDSDRLRDNRDFLPHHLAHPVR